MRTTFRTRLAASAALLTAAGLLAACGGDDGEKISIVGFAVPEAANKAISEEFNETKAGEGVEFSTSYGASGDQSRAVEKGLDADYVHLSVGTDVDRLVDARQNIQDWDDLTKPGVEIVTPNPASSGAARWNALAAWGHVTENGGSEKEATKFVEDLFANVVSLTNSGRDATQSFLGGTGDVLLAYENEAILAAQNGNGFEYVIPETSLLIENPGATLEDATPTANDWLDFVLSPDGQRQFALNGFRPLNQEEPGTADLASLDLEPSDIEGAPDPEDPFPTVKKLLTLEEDFGGWDGVKDKLFGDGKDGAPVGIVTQAIEKSGKASS